MRLQTRYSFIIVALLIAVVIFISAILLLQFRASMSLQKQVSGDALTDDLRNQLQQRGTVMTYYLSEALVYPVYNYDLPTIQQVIEPSLAREDVLSVQVFDPDGNFIHDGSEDFSAFGEPLKDLEVVDVLTQKDKLFVKNDSKKMIIAYPIWLGDAPLGGVRIEFSFESINREVTDIEQQLRLIGEQRLRDNAYTILFTALGTILLGIFMAVVTSRSLIRPIKKLASYAAQIGSGDYRVSIDIDRRDELGELARAFEEMSQGLERSTHKIRHQAYHDHLTGLPNRLMLREHLKHILPLAKRNNEMFAIFFIDLDDFKRVNDTMGHDVGDELLIGVTQRFRQATREHDFIGSLDDADENATLCRLGGDEFTLVLSNISRPSDCSLVARRIIEQLSKPFILSDREFVVGASVGITVYPDDGSSIDVLLKNADIAMYYAKESGKNRFQYFTAAMNCDIQERIEIEEELRRALDRDEFILNYQPQIDIESGEILGAEALIRWQHPTKGLISPFVFIPVAEQTGLIDKIGDWVIKTACREAKTWQEEDGRDFWVSVNVSSVQFRQGDLSERIMERLKQSGLDPHLLHVEITETSLVSSEDQTAATLSELRASGIKIWMDDFGTGFSSLSYLRRFPIDGVKIDRSFVRDIEIDSNDLALTSAIVGMAHGLNLIVVAEGVETEGQLTLLRGKRCNISQGYLHSKPVVANTFRQLIGKQRSAASVSYLRKIKPAD